MRADSSRARRQRLVSVAAEPHCLPPLGRLVRLAKRLLKRSKTKAVWALLGQDLAAKKIEANARLVAAGLPRIKE